MRVVYVAGRYRAKTIFGVVINILRARWVAIKLWKWGYAVICPHMNTALFPHEKSGRFSEDGIEYIKGDLEIIDRLREDHDLMVLLPKWQKSEGTKSELDRARNISLKVYEWEHDKDYLKARGRVI